VIVCFQSFIILIRRSGGSACESNTPLPVRTTAGFEDREDHRILSASLFAKRNPAVDTQQMLP